MKLYDISVPITTRMPVWPGDPPISIEKLADMDNGDSANVSQIQMSVHTGTHIDAPRHFIPGGKTVDQVSLQKLVGEVLVIEIANQDKAISREVLVNHPDADLLRKASKVLFKTINSVLWQSPRMPFQKDFVGIEISGADYLAQLDLDLIGLDYLSIAAFEDTLLPHQTLLAHETVLLEGINLSGINPGFYNLFCLPLNIQGCEGAPARVILIED